MNRSALVPLIAFALPLFADNPPRVEFSRYLASLFDGNVTGVATDAAGNIYVAGFTRGLGFPLVRPIQTQGSIYLAKLDPTGANLIYSTLLGSGSPADSPTGLAVDAAGNAYLVGTTNSAVFPTVNALQPRLTGPVDAFVLKVDPTGQRILYSTYLGGSDFDVGMSIAVDANGCAYVAGYSESRDFPVTAGAFLTDGGAPGLFVSKLARDGSRLLYSTYLGKIQTATVKIAVTSLDEATVLATGVGAGYVAKLNAAGSALVYRTNAPPGAGLGSIAVDPGGFVWAAGYSFGGTPVTVDAAQPRPGGSSYYRSADGGVTWTAGASGLNATSVSQIATDSSGRLFAGTSQGLFRSGDGVEWTRILEGPVSRVVTDRNAPGTIYAVRSGETPLVKSVDGGETWQALSVDGEIRLNALALDPQLPGRLYAAGSSRIYRSDDGGANWTAGPLLQGAGVLSVAVDASDSSIVYANVSSIPGGGGLGPGISIGGGLFRSTDGGQTYTRVSGVSSILSFAPDPSSPGTVYAAGPGLLKSTDFGAHWQSMPAQLPGASYISIVVDDAGVLEALTIDGRILRSEDRGATLTAAGGLQAYGARTFARVNGVLHLGGSANFNVYVMRIDNSGDVAFATYWGGRLGDSASDVTVDKDGNAYVVGNASSPDFPQRQSIADFAGVTDAFVLKFASDGTLLYSTTWGGSGQDFARAASADPGRQIVFAGITYSPEAPVPRLYVTALR